MLQKLSFVCCLSTECVEISRIKQAQIENILYYYTVFKRKHMYTAKYFRQDFEIFKTVEEFSFLITFTQLFYFFISRTPHELFTLIII